MRTVKLLAALTVGAAFLAACKDDNPKKVEVIGFTSFGFTVEANPEYLNSDIVEESITSQALSFTLPFGTDPAAVNALVPTFTVTEGAAVYTVDETGAPTDVPVVSGETALDFAEELSLVVSKDNNYSLYTVKVTVKEASKWTKVAESPFKMWSDPVITISRNDDKPYFVGTDSTNRYPHIFKYDGSAELKDVAGALAEEEAKYMALDFDPDNNPYVTYYGGTLKKQTVVTVKDGAAAPVGEAGSLSTTTGSSNSSSAVFPISANEVWAAHYNNTKTDAVAKRALNLALYDGATWTNGKAIEGRPTSNYGYCVLGRYYDDVPYLFVFNQNVHTISLYHYSNGTWATDYEGLEFYKADGTEKVGKLHLCCFNFDFDTKGNLYLMVAAGYSVTEVYNIAVVRISKEDGTQTLIGGETDINMDNYRCCDFALDANDVPYLVYTKPEGSNIKYATIRYIDPKTKGWSEEVRISDAKADWAQIRYAEDGTGYIVVSNEDTDKYDLYSSAE